MTDVAAALAAGLAAVTPLEALAVGLAVAYLVLAIRQHPACWWCAVASAVLYIRVMYAANLYMESALQLFYIAMALYGWWTWRGGAAARGGRRVTDWPIVLHLLPLLLIAVLTGISGVLLSAIPAAAFPYADSFTTWGAIVATWLVARKVLQNWYYWFVIDAVSVYLYWQRDLVPTALLFCVYLVLIVIGYRVWRDSLRRARS